MVKDMTLEDLRKQQNQFTAAATRRGVDAVNGNVDRRARRLEEFTAAATRRGVSAVNENVDKKAHRLEEFTAAATKRGVGAVNEHSDKNADRVIGEIRKSSNRLSNLQIILGLIAGLIAGGVMWVMEKNNTTKPIAFDAVGNATAWGPDLFKLAVLSIVTGILAFCVITWIIEQIQK